jgi:hypothetical protein
VRRRWLGLLVSLVVLWPALSWGQATALQCGTVPTQAQTGWPVQPAVVVLMVDSTGTLVSTYTGFVTAAAAQAPSGGTLSGITTVQATAQSAMVGAPGVSGASFTGLVLTGVGTWRLTFSAPGLTSCTTPDLRVGLSLHLAAASPGRRIGLAQPGTIVTDYDGCPVAQSGLVDAGALQYRSGGDCVSGAGLPPPQNFSLGP